MPSLERSKPTVLAHLPTKLFETTISEDAVICRFNSKAEARFALYSFCHVFATWAENFGKRQTILSYPGCTEKSPGYQVLAVFAQPCIPNPTGN